MGLMAECTLAESTREVADLEAIEPARMATAPAGSSQRRFIGIPLLPYAVVAEKMHDAWCTKQ